MATLLGIDIGTSGTKAILVDENGVVLRTAHAPHHPRYPQAGWSESDPEEWWDAVLACLHELDCPRPDAIGLTGQMHGSAFLDADGEVLRPALLWNDQRTVEECAEIDRVIGPERLRRITGNPPLTGFQLPKLLWLRNHELSRYNRLAHVLLPKDFIRWKLTGVAATDVSDASGVGLLDVAARNWSSALMAELEIDPRWFPPVFESGTVTGHTRGVPGLEDGVPVVAGAGDQAAGGVGCGAIASGVVSVSLGTSGVVFGAIEAPTADPTGASHVFCHANGGWHAMGVTLGCGGSVAWLRDCLIPVDHAELERLAASAEPGAGGVTFLPHLSGERSPHNDPHARGVFAGLSMATGRAEIARAVFEGATLALWEAGEALAKLGVNAERLRVTGGGARSTFWVQMLADLFGRPCEILEADEGPSFGAALIAGSAAGIWPDLAGAVAHTVRVRRVVEPQAGLYTKTIYNRYQGLYRHVQGWARPG